jgi:hypothetical protein
MFLRNTSPPTSGSKKKPSKKTKKQHEACSKQSNGLHGIISQKIELFITTAEPQVLFNVHY